MDNFDSYKLKDKTKHGLIDKIILHDSNVYFVIKKVDHSVSAAGWTTDIGCKVELDSLNLANKLRKEEGTG